MYLYFIKESGMSGFVKIGIAQDVDARLAGLQTGNPRRLILVRATKVENGLFEESRAHSAFRKNHISGEWFLFCDEMLTWEPPPYVFEKKNLNQPPSPRNALRADVATAAGRVFAAFGGVDRLAYIIGLKEATLRQWQYSADKNQKYRRGHIPVHHRKRIKDAAAALGVTLNKRDCP